MNKQAYVTEMLQDMLEEYQIPAEILKECAGDIVAGLDTWYELSGESVASSNRYAAIERENEEKLEAVRKQVENMEKRMQKEAEDHHYILRRKNNVISDYYEKYGPLND